MIYKVKNKEQPCFRIQIKDNTILETHAGWHIDEISYPDWFYKGEDLDVMFVVIRKGDADA